MPMTRTGKISQAFSSHIFYPEPPKKAKTSKLTPTQLFPACISSKTWRDMHRTKDRVHTNVPEKKSRTFQGLLLHFSSTFTGPLSDSAEYCYFEMVFKA